MVERRQDMPGLLLQPGYCVYHPLHGYGVVAATGSIFAEIHFTGGISFQTSRSSSVDPKRLYPGPIINALRREAKFAELRIGESIDHEQFGLGRIEGRQGATLLVRFEQSDAVREIDGTAVVHLWGRSIDEAKADAKAAVESGSGVVNVAVPALVNRHVKQKAQLDRKKPRLKQTLVTKTKSSKTRTTASLVTPEEQARIGMHEQLLQIARSAEATRSWIPMREETTIFRDSYMSRGQQRIVASDYGHRAFRFTVKGRHRKEPANQAKRYDAIPSPHRLASGICVGDRIRHLVVGTGIVLSITKWETIVQFDRVGLRVYSTDGASEQLRKV